MTDIKKYTMDDVLIDLHLGAWWKYTDWDDRTYANLRVSEGFDYTLPTEEELNTQVAQLQADYDAKEYQRKRKAEYPKIQDLVVALYDTDDKAAIEAKRAEVKLKYPKP
jgi:hypothetical protein